MPFTARSFVRSRKVYYRLETALYSLCYERNRHGTFEDGCYRGDETGERYSICSCILITSSWNLSSIKLDLLTESSSLFIVLLLCSRAVAPGGLVAFLVPGLFQAGGIQNVPWYAIPLLYVMSSLTR